MLGIQDFWVWGAYVLTILSALLCLIYGLAYWRGNAAPTPTPEDEEWVEEESKIGEGL